MKSLYLYFFILLLLISIKNIISFIKIDRSLLLPQNLQTDDDYLYFFYQYYLSPSPTDAYIPTILSYFTKKNNATMINIFSSSQYYTQFFYSTIMQLYDKKNSYLILENLLKNYSLFFLNEQKFQIDVKISPCSDSGIQYCCENLGQCFHENLNITGKKDLEIAYFFNNFFPGCGGEFKDRCGTFFEIHSAGSPRILQESKVKENFSSGYKTLFLSTKSLCAGKYELWNVIRMRDFNYIIYVKPFYVNFPSCTNKEVIWYGYTPEVKNG